MCILLYSIWRCCGFRLRTWKRMTGRLAHTLTPLATGREWVCDAPVFPSQEHILLRPYTHFEAEIGSSYSVSLPPFSLNSLCYATFRSSPPPPSSLTPALSAHSQCSQPYRRVSLSSASLCVQDLWELRPPICSSCEPLSTHTPCIQFVMILLLCVSVGLCVASIWLHGPLPGRGDGQIYCTVPPHQQEGMVRHNLNQMHIIHLMLNVRKALCISKFPHSLYKELFTYVVVTILLYSVSALLVFAKGVDRIRLPAEYVITEVS